MRGPAPHTPCRTPQSDASRPWQDGCTAPCQPDAGGVALFLACAAIDNKTKRVRIRANCPSRMSLLDALPTESQPDILVNETASSTASDLAAEAGLVQESPLTRSARARRRNRGRGLSTAVVQEGAEQDAPPTARQSSVVWNAIVMAIIAAVAHILHSMLGMAEYCPQRPANPRHFSAQHAIFSEMRALQPASVLGVNLGCLDSVPSSSDLRRMSSAPMSIHQIDLGDMPAPGARSASYALALACLPELHLNSTMGAVFGLGRHVANGGKIVLVFRTLNVDALIKQCCHDKIFHPVMSYPALDDNTSVLVLEHSANPSHNEIYCQQMDERRRPV